MTSDHSQSILPVLWTATITLYDHGLPRAANTKAILCVEEGKNHNPKVRGFPITVKYTPILAHVCWRIVEEPGHPPFNKHALAEHTSFDTRALVFWSVHNLQRSMRARPFYLVLEMTNAVS